MPIQITSLQNPHVKAAAALREARERRRRHRIIIDGVREIQRAFESGVVFKEVFFCPAMITPDAEQLLKQVSTPPTELFEVNYLRIMSY